MKVETVTFNACDWTGTIHTVKYCSQPNGDIKFKFRGEEFNVTFTKKEERGDEKQLLWSCVSGKVYAKGWEHPLAKLCRWGTDQFWTATDDDYLNGITREHDNPVAAICQILCNIM